MAYQNNNILGNVCGFEEIPSFASPGEFERFTKFLDKKIEEGTAAEVPHDPNYHSGQLFGGRWFECINDKKIWRLLKPDFPFRGRWELVSNYEFRQTGLSFKISDIGTLQKFEWAHMWYAMKMGWLSHSVFVQKATWEIKHVKDSADENVTKLAGLHEVKERREIEGAVYQLAYKGGDLGLNKIRDDWAIYLCCSLLESDPSLDDLHLRIDRLWGELGSPDILLPFLYFMPPAIDEPGNIKTRLKSLCQKNGYC